MTFPWALGHGLFSRRFPETYFVDASRVGIPVQPFATTDETNVPALW